VGSGNATVGEEDCCWGAGGGGKGAGGGGKGAGGVGVGTGGVGVG
jgi:hypothetical protein